MCKKSKITTFSVEGAFELSQSKFGFEDFIYLESINMNSCIFNDDTGNNLLIYFAKKNIRLKELSLDNCRFNLQANILKNFLIKHKHLRLLHLAGISVDLFDVNVLKNMLSSQITSLNLPKFEIKNFDMFCEDFSRNFVSLKLFNLGITHHSTHPYLKKFFLTILQPVKSFNIHYVNQNHQESCFFENLSTDTLKNISITNLCQSSDALLNCLNRVRELNVISMQHCKISLAVLEKLFKTDNLTIVRFDDVITEDENTVEKFFKKSSNRLENLEITKSKFENEFYKQLIQQKFMSLKILNISANNLLGNIIVHLLDKISGDECQLIELYFFGNELKLENLDDLSRIIVNFQCLQLMNTSLNTSGYCKNLKELINSENFTFFHLDYINSILTDILQHKILASYLINKIGVNNLIELIKAFSCKFKKFSLSINEMCYIFENIDDEQTMFFEDAEIIYIEDQIPWEHHIENVINAMINQCKKLNVLCLKNFQSNYENFIGSRISCLLSQNKNLQIITLKNNCIGNTMMVEILDSLHYVSQHLKCIDFQTTYFNFKLCKNLEELFSKFSCLTKLNLSGNNLGSVLSKTLFEILSKKLNSLRILFVDNCNFDNDIDDSLSKLIKSNLKIDTISIGNNKIGNKVAKKLFEVVSELCENLTFLQIDNCEFTHKAAYSLGQIMKNNKNLTFFNISSNEIENKAGNYILDEISKNCCDIEYLGLGNIKLDCSAKPFLVKSIQKNPKLKSLNISCNNFNWETMQNILETLTETSKDLFHLDANFLHLNDQVGDSLCQFLDSSKNLSNLNIAFNKNIGNKSLIKIFEILSKNCKDLSIIIAQSLKIDHTFQQSFCRNIQQISNITYLSLSYNPIGSKFAKELFQIIADHFKAIKGLFFRKCDLNNEIEDSLANAILSNHMLNEIDISKNKIGSKIGQGIIESLAKSCKKLTIINFSSCNFDYTVGASLSDVINMNKDLLTLDISYNNLKNNAAGLLFSSIGSNCKQLKELHCIKIGLVGGIEKVLAEAVENSPLIETLDLRLNKLVSNEVMFILDKFAQTRYSQAIFMASNYRFYDHIKHYIKEFNEKHEKPKIRDIFSMKTSKYIPQTPKSDFSSITQLEIILSVDSIDSYLANYLMFFISFKDIPRKKYQKKKVTKFDRLCIDYINSSFQFKILLQDQKNKKKPDKPNKNRKIIQKRKHLRNTLKIENDIPFNTFLYYLSEIC